MHEIPKIEFQKFRIFLGLFLNKSKFWRPHKFNVYQTLANDFRMVYYTVYEIS